MRAIGSIVFGFRWVVLIDFDGERTIRRVRFIGERPYANRMQYLSEPVGLLDGGAVEGCEWVSSWEPYRIFAAKRFPTYPLEGWE